MRRVLRSLALGLCAGALAAAAPACRDTAVTEPDKAPQASELRSAAYPRPRSAGKTPRRVIAVIAGDARTDRIIVMDPRRRGAQRRAVRWSWRPTAARGYGDVAAGWDLVSEVRVRTLGRKTYVVTADGSGFIGAIEYPSGRRRWAINAGPRNLVHAAELLPDGNVAAAAARHGWIRIYAASLGPAATTFTQFRLRGGHGVLWDPRRRVLWALGQRELIALRIGGTPAAPNLTRVFRTALPSHGGHDLAPVYGNRNRLWITTNQGVYQFNKRRRAFTTRYRRSASVSRTFVKAVGDHPRTGQVLRTRLKRGCGTSWCTDTMEFIGPGPRTTIRTIRNAQLYKARWFVPAYQ